MQILDISHQTAKTLVKTVCLGVAPEPIYFSLSKTGNFFKTSLEPLDRCLRGGLPCATITEIVGPSGCGKTQFSLMLSVLATLPTQLGGLGGEVIYIDTENAFSAKRLVEIAQHRFPEHFPKDSPNITSLTQSVHVIFIQTSEDLLEKLNSLEETIIKNQVKLIVLDSVASLIRKEFKGTSMERTDILAKQASTLKYLSASFQIPVVVTNQVTTRYDLPAGFEKTGSSHASANDEVTGNFIIAALGNTWSHAVNTRLIVEYVPAKNGQSVDLRKIKITKSPTAPFASFYYQITASGINLVENVNNSDDQSVESFEDPLNMITINSRSNAALKSGRFRQIE